MKPLETIGFYTLSDERVAQASEKSPLYRCEMILTGRCNLRCPYCRGLPAGADGDIDSKSAKRTLGIWADEGMRNVRFSGGEPMLHPNIGELVKFARDAGAVRIAISTNGTLPLRQYMELVDLGANDFSISLDAGCCAVGDVMSGVSGTWGKAAGVIRELAKRTYVSVGVVFTEANAGTAMETVLFIDSLGPADIRVIPSAQWNRAVASLTRLPQDVLDRYPILKYRIGNMVAGRNIRGIASTDSGRCPISLDDVAVAGEWHFPCIIYLREHGKPIGPMDSSMRLARLEWFKSHNTHDDPICRGNCIDCVVDYNNKWEALHRPSKDAKG